MLLPVAVMVVSVHCWSKVASVSERLCMRESPFSFFNGPRA